MVKVGDIIYIPTQFHVYRGKDDISGGKVRVVLVEPMISGGKEIVGVRVEGFPGHLYNWTQYLGPKQEEYTKEYGDSWAKQCPDHGLEFNQPETDWK